MRLRMTLYLVILFLAAVSADSAEVRQSPLPDGTRQTTESGQSTPSAFSDDSIFTNYDIPNRNPIDKLNENDVNNVDQDLELLLLEGLITEDKIIEENERNSKSSSDENEKSDSVVNNSENADESKISTDIIRRQGDQSPEEEVKKSSSSVEFDDSKQEVSDPPPRFGQRKSKQKAQDGEANLRLTQGGYDRPFKRTRFRNRYASRPDSSEQSSQVQEPDRNTNDNKPDSRRIVPQVLYSPSAQLPPSLGPRQILNPGFETPTRNMVAMHHVVPTTTSSRFYNTPPTLFADYPTTPFQAQFPANNEIGGFPNFVRDPNNAALYQSSQTNNPFQTPELLFQNNPDEQTQSIVIDPARNIQSQFQQNPFIAYRGFENSENSARPHPNYGAYFRNPSVNTQIQVPPNFYAVSPNGMNPFTNPPISFLSNYPNSDDALSQRFFRNPFSRGVQSNQQNARDKQLDSEASQEGKNDGTRQEAVSSGNRDGPTSVQFGARLQAQNQQDVYMRYPTNEAGYATPENLPPRNSSDEVTDNSQQTSSEQRNVPTTESFRNGLNSARTNQRINNSFNFPPELFRDAPVDFGYQRPQSQFFTLDRNRGESRYPSSDFVSRNPFSTIESFPENNYQILNVDNRGHKESDETPACAKQSNASFCFEDNEYPKNDILYSLSSNSYLADRLLAPELSLNSVTLVERNDAVADQNTENYACSVNTKYGTPLRAKNLAGAWKTIVNIDGKFSQPVRMEVCKSLGDPCSHIADPIKTTCVQKHNIQRLVSWSPGRGIYSDVFKIPVACSCQILEEVKP